MNSRTIKGITTGIFAMVAGMALADTVQVTVNGNPVNFPDTQPQMVNGHVFVPLRGVFEAIGATVIWDEATQSISASTDRRHVRLRIGDLDASIDGRVVSMDTAPQISGGSTMVPLRFLSQSLGASVDWQPQQNLVAITSRSGGDSARGQHIDHPVVQRNPNWNQSPQGQQASRITFESYNVIPLRLDQTISSDGSQEGDSFTATVRGDQDGYMDLPRGTVVTGVVRRARAARGDQPGVLEVRFTHIQMPSGKLYPINGTVAPLNDSNITRSANGRFVAKKNEDVKNNVGRDAAIGAGAGLVLGSLHARALGGAAIGGVLGAIVGALTPEHHDANVHINQGTQLGLILSKDLTIDRRDL